MYVCLYSNLLHWRSAIATLTVSCNYGINGNYSINKADTVNPFDVPLSRRDYRHIYSHYLKLCSY